ncbi:hypothetical protein J6590_068136 [Homalodisca vitripennis]|nr:hypothetical protein J6590_068136 [Homalodisca vitripennis]
MLADTSRCHWKDFHFPSHPLTFARHRRSWAPLTPGVLLTPLVTQAFEKSIFTAHSTSDTIEHAAYEYKPQQPLQQPVFGNGQSATFDCIYIIKASTNSPVS